MEIVSDAIRQDRVSEKIEGTPVQPVFRRA
jgi:hypothetical protein